MSDSEKTDALVQLAGSVAHELNNIFTAVAGNLSFLEDAFGKNDSNAKLVDDVIRTAHRGIELSRKLQAFAGRQPLKRTRINLNRAAVHVIADLKTTLLRAVEVELDLTRADCMVVADEEKLHFVLRELAGNAVAAMEQRGRLCLATKAVAVGEGEIAGLAPGVYVRLTVRDSGRGMKPEVARRALDPFFTTKPGGAERGWGLSKCAGFVRQCGGRILLSSEPGRGTTVHIYLPRLIEAAAA
jgi:signal transduction histidine kinase